MASKSKKRRRVLGASCILAALIIAGSSFAWFTSSDEVTNRLQASSDYGVSIVESFTPPKNMLPGQEVNKDVYAVNTGNIAAFVKEDVSGVLNYTFESKVASWDDKCVELTLAQAAAIEGATMKDGYKTMEAGGYLAWTDATSTTTGSTKTYSVDGKEFTADKLVDDSTQANIPNESNADNKSFNKKYVDGPTTYYMEKADPENGDKLYLIKEDGDGISKPVKYYVDSGKTLSIKDDTTTSPAITPGPLYSGRDQDIKTPWYPTETGTYIFRRSIGGTAAAPTFEYAGYYYDKTGNKYYKIVIGNDQYRAASTTPGTPTDYEFDVSAPSSALAGVTINKDGEITAGTPKISFVKDTEVKDKKVTFTYEENNGKPRLVALYAADAPTTTISGVEYDASAMAARTEVDYNNKLGEANKATVEYNQAKAEYDYAKALAEARNTLVAAADVRDAADQAESSKKTAYENAWTSLKQATSDAITNYGTQVRAPFVADYLVKADYLGNTPKLFTAATVTRIKDDTATPKLEQAQANLTKLEKLQDDVVGTMANPGASDPKGLDQQLAAVLVPISNAGSAEPNKTPAEVKTAIDSAKSLIDQMYDKMIEYKDAYSSIVDEDTTATALNINNDDLAKKAKIQQLATALKNLKTSMDSAYDTYKARYDEYQKAHTDAGTAQTTWEKAIDDYNKAVGKPGDAPADYDSATENYEKVVQQTAPAIQPTPKAAYSDTNGTSNITKDIVKTYSANNSDPNATADPQINKNDAKVKTGWQKLMSTGTGALGTTTVPTETDYSLTTKKDAMDTAVDAANTAKNAYDDAVTALQAASKIKIYVNLAEDYATNWTIDPADRTGSQDVDFYLNKILEAGETSEKLIDSVVLDQNTKASDYKNLTFDLNVGLDSAQITYANDQRTITTEATAGWALQPRLTDNQSIDTAVTWDAPTP